MKDNFPRAFNIVIGEEGGYVNDPEDPGRETKYGISKRSYPKEDIVSMTIDRAKQIYLVDFWGRIGADDLPCGLDIAAFDCAVNQGVPACKKLLSDAGGDLCRFMRLRLARYSGTVANRPISLKYLRGWLNRVLSIWDKIDQTA